MPYNVEILFVSQTDKNHFFVFKNWKAVEHSTQTHNTHVASSTLKHINRTKDDDMM
jgi:hypothetical protein